MSVITPEATVSLSPYLNDEYLYASSAPLQTKKAVTAYEAPPILQTPTYFKGVQKLDQVDDEQLKHMLDRVGAVFQDHQKLWITPLKFKKVLSGFVSVETAVMGLALLMNFSFRLPFKMLLAVVALGIGSLQTSVVACKHFKACFKEYDLDHRGARNQVMNEIKHWGLKRLSETFSYKQIVDYDLLSGLMSSSISKKDKAMFYLNFNAFFDRMQEIEKLFQEDTKKDVLLFRNFGFGYSKGINSRNYRYTYSQWSRWFSAQHQKNFEAYKAAKIELEEAYKNFLSETITVLKNPIK